MMHQKLALSLLTLFLLVMLLAMNAFAAPPADKAAAPVLNELFVLFDDSTSSESVVEEVNGNAPDTGISNRLGSPQSARLLISDRLPLADRDKLGPDNPEVLLQQYIVIKYPDTMSPIALNNIKGMLVKDPDILWVQENSYGEFSVSPNDPLFPVGAVPNPLPTGTTAAMWYQWGMTRLNLPAAWDFVRGNAYISSLDNGIMLGHEDLDSTSSVIKNFREHFSYDFVNHVPNVDELNLSTFAGHGTHVAGILAASTNSTNAQGVAGACWNCNLMIGKISTSDGKPSLSASIDGVNRMLGAGTQAINMSLGFKNADYTPYINCSTAPNDPFCLELASAETKDVVIVSASGNYNKPYLQFPASDSNVISVGAVDSTDHWWYNSTNIGSNYGSRLDLVAPGVDILSTFYTDRIWNAVPPYSCADYISGPSEYGPCTGTSMAAPHITGLVGLLRSANPLLNKINIKDILTSTASQFPNRDDFKGFGIPNAAEAVKKALGTVGGNQLKNRLTPLFSFYSTTLQNHFYTTVPQMANAALTGFLRPNPGSGFFYSPIGSPSPGYLNFPGRSCAFSPCADSPKASVYIFTTENPPFTGAPVLWPLYRLSYLGVNHVDHTYTTDQAGINAYVGVGYNLDGIEGYIYPRSTTPQPTGTVKLYRKYNPTRDDHAIFPESELSAMTAQGYTGNDGNDWIGYVYPNIDSDGDGLINGFETLIGTCINTADTNGDGTNDGDSVLTYSTTTHSYKEPGQCLPLLTVNKAGSGSGTVSSNPSGISCGTDCTNTYSQGTSVTLTASASTGSTFSGWNGGGCSGTGTCIVIMNSATTVTATFMPKYTLTVTKSGTGVGTVASSPAGINCGSDCSEQYNSGTSVTLTATPNAGSGFSGWSSGGCSGKSTCTLSMSSAKTVNAIFAKTWYEETDSAITYTGTWTPYTCSSCSGGSMKYAGATGASASISFYGTGVKLRMTKNSNLGIANIYVDGAYYAAVDQYSPTVQYQYVVQRTGLATGNHTASIQVSGQKNGSSAGYYVTLDAIEIIP